jgi:hypothetical protein
VEVAVQTVDLDKVAAVELALLFMKLDSLYHLAHIQ